MIKRTFKVVILLCAVGVNSKSYAINPPTLEHKIKVLEAEKILCQSLRKEAGFSFFPDYKRIYMRPINMDTKSGKMDLSVKDWSGRSLQEDMIYRDACTFKSPNLSCRFDGNSFQISLHEFNKRSFANKMWNLQEEDRMVYGTVLPSREQLDCTMANIEF